MRQGQQHRRGRGRNNNNNNQHHRKGQNPLARSFESNGPDVKVRGTPAHIAEKYISLARDASSSGDPVLAENYLQHAEHYNRIILAYREQQGLQSGGGDSNGGGGQHRMRSDQLDLDEAAEDEAQQEDFGHGEQPMVGRFPQENQPRQEGHRNDDRPQRNFDNQMRFRDRQERQHDRQDRPRHDRFDRHDRPDRQDRGDRGDRPERSFGGDRQPYDRGERPQQQAQDRGFEDRPDRPDDTRQAEPRPDQRPARDRDRMADMQPAGPAMDTLSAPRAEAGPSRSEGPRRRERFGHDQPDFLRRPVRRPRREVEAAAPGAEPHASVPDEPKPE